MAHTQGEPGAEPGPASNPQKEYERQLLPRQIGFGDKVSIGTFAWMNAVYEWADYADMDVILVRDLGEWYAIVRLRDAIGPFQVEIPVIQPLVPKKGRKEMLEPFYERVAKHISKAIQKAREDRIKSYTKCRPAGIKPGERHDIDQLVDQANQKAKGRG